MLRHQLHAFLHLASQKRESWSAHRGRCVHPKIHERRNRTKLALLLAHQLMGYTDSSSGAFLGHGMLWTKIFEHFNLDLSGEEAVYITEENAITSRSLNKMGRGTVVDRKGKRNKAAVENVPSQPGTSLDS
ncbi:hypothetical protein PIB30_037055 [Stylosanthes scabra]|uniref:Uncharacterized protein n=1 Tax=Stylosanthes scabra TaxID=79078 RepID=A0ABU6VF45_9FABA|nr:hypothetical protein [Stylosanthes scabra]